MSLNSIARLARHNRLLQAIAAAAVIVVALIAAAPRAPESGLLLIAQDDPSAVAEQVLDKSLSQQNIAIEIETALASDDADLANSLVELARDRGLAVAPALADRVAAASTTSAAVSRSAHHFVRGLISGEPTDMTEFTGTALGDLFVFGDLRDAVRQGARLAKGEQADELVLGLACVGLAVTAGTYASLGLGAPVRVGLSLAKAARKTGRIGNRLAGVMTRALRETVDWSALRRALATASLSEPAVAVRAAREAIKTEKAGGLMRMLGDIGRVEAKAGTQAAFDGLKLARSPAEVSQLAKLAEKQGSKTRAVLKLAGRSAVAVGFATFRVAAWLSAALLGSIAFMWTMLSGVFGFLWMVKRVTERATGRYGRWRKHRRAMQRVRELERMLEMQSRRQVLAMAPGTV